jgi:hypothetical protein
MHARRHAGTQARRHAGTQARRHAGTQARTHAGTHASTHTKAARRGMHAKGRRHALAGEGDALEAVEHLGDARGGLGEHGLDRDAGRELDVVVQRRQPVLGDHGDDGVEGGVFAEHLLQHLLGLVELL